MAILFAIQNFRVFRGFGVKIENSILRHDYFVRILGIVVSVALNVFLSFLVDRFNIPLFLDTAGTIGVTYLFGLFPGIIVSVLTNIFCALFNSSFIYFVVINAIIAIITMYFTQRNYFRSFFRIAEFVAIVAVVAGVLGSFIQWCLFGMSNNPSINEAVDMFSSYSNIPSTGSLFIINILLNIVDKAICVALIILVFKFIPKELQSKLQTMFWRQRPLSMDDINEIKNNGGKIKFSLQKKVTVMLVFAISLMSFVVSFISLFIYNENKESEYRVNAQSAVKFAASVIDADSVDNYLSLGEEAYNLEDYNTTNELLKKIKETTPGLSYLYVVKIKPTGCYYVFDVETDDEEAYKPGEYTAIEDAFEEYLPALLTGESIPPIESDDISGWVLTVYEPIFDEDGRCVAYVGADVSLERLNSFMKTFLLRVMVVLAGFYILVLACGLWITGVFMVYPINSIALYMKRFAKSGKSQEEMDESTKNLRKLDIRTNDEVESLYNSLCDVAGTQTEQMRNIRRFSEATTRMQDGLIITMADMVENRDSDTGAHIQKTSAYVRIIVDGLKAKGYYAEKLTDKYISDVIRSAPLHDVGKINIPDNILNKPGKLTDEEFEIMKTHTTAGKKIMEDAISTVNGENYLKEARNMAAYHHERWDGKGYPEKLHGEVIPLSARIMAVADVFDALTSPRVYKPAFPIEKALEIIEDGAGKQFDPKVVEAFVDSLDQVELILKKYNPDM